MRSILSRLLKSPFRQHSTNTTIEFAAPTSDSQQPRLLFAFHGGNKPRPHVGRELYQHDTAFRRAIQRCSGTIEHHLGFTLSGVLEGHEVSPAVTLEETERRNVVILSALELALCDLLSAHGVEPDATVGISGGEVAASYAAGALTLEETTAVLCSVATVVTQRPLKGHFIWLDLEFEKALKLVLGSPVKLDVFMELGPLSSLAYCTDTDFPDAQLFLSERSVGHRTAETEWAHHTPWAEEALRTTAGTLYEPQPRPLSCPMYSPVTGDLIPAGTVLDKDYWYKAAVTPIMFGRAMCGALADGYNVILNVCNHPTLRAGIEESTETLNKHAVIIDTMRREEPEMTTWNAASHSLNTLGLVHTHPRNNGRGKFSASFQSQIDLLSRDVVRNPYPHFATLRQTGSVHFLEQHGFWIVLDYDDVVHAFKNPGVFSSAQASAPFDPVLVQADPPAHTRVRRILSPHFSTQGIQALEDYTRSKAEKLLAAGDKKDEFDLVSDFATPLTEMVLSHFLQLSDDKSQSLRRELNAHKFHVDKSSLVLEDWSRAYVTEKEKSPSEDLCSQLLRGKGESALTPDEVVSLIKLLWDAGTVTTSLLIATSAHLLLRHPAVRDEVRSNLELLPRFIEEALRFEAPSHLSTRVTLEAAELSGAKIPAGAGVKLCIGAANRDPKHFVKPDSFSLERNPNAHLTFGAGPHYCLGAMFARMEARVALEVLLTMWPNFSAARPLSTVRYIESIQFRAVKSLLVKAA